MRINIYNEELTDDITIVEKEVSDPTHGDRVYYGLRLFLKSPDELHYHPDDDDRSAVTIWFKEGEQAKQVRELMSNLYDAMDATFS